MVLTDHGKKVIGATLGFALMKVLMRNAGFVIVFLRDLVLAWFGFSVGANWLWRRAVASRSVGPVSGWHGGQVAMVVVSMVALMAWSLSNVDPLFRALGEEALETSSLSRLALLGMLYPVVACPLFAFWLTWTWFGSRARR